jgi:outer membrane lipoprotein-sorting protein
LLKVEQLEANGNVTTYLLKDHRTNKKIDDEVFAFEVPKGAEVLDRRAPAVPHD